MVMIPNHHQMNDCWPTTSWAIVDYFLRPKPAYFTVARELRPITVGMTRKEIKTFSDELSAADLRIETILQVWGTNSTLLEKKAYLEVTLFDLHSDWTNQFTKDIVLEANSSTELFSGQLPGQPIRTKLSEIPRVIIASARLLDESGAVLGRYSNWYVRQNQSHDTDLSISRYGPGRSLLNLSSSLLLKIWGWSSKQLTTENRYHFLPRNP